MRFYEACPSDPPDHRPSISVIQSLGNRVKIRLSDPEAPMRVARPRGVNMAVVFWTVDEREPGPDEPVWHIKLSSRTTTEIVFPVGLPPGTKVWIAARWVGYNHKMGMRSAAVSTYLMPAPGVLSPSTLRSAG